MCGMHEERNPMTTITIDRAVVEQALEALGSSQYPQPRQMAAITALRAALEQEQAEPTPPPEAVTEAEKTAYAAGWWAAMAKGGSNLPPLRAEPKSLPCPTPGACQWHCCGGWCGPRAETKA